MYKVKSEMVELLKDGRTNNYFCEILGLTNVHISNIFNGRKCKKIIAISLISIREKISVNDDKIGELLNYYFDKIQ